MQLVVYDTAGTYEVSKPFGAVWCDVTAISSTDGAASGAKGTTNVSGGAGSGSAAIVQRGFLASELPDIITCVVGQGGVGGAAVTTNSTGGNLGTAGTPTTFGPYLKAGVGRGPLIYTAGGQPGSGNLVRIGGVDGTAGGASGSNAPSSSLSGTTGGGGGGNISSGLAQAPGNGGSITVGTNQSSGVAVEATGGQGGDPAGNGTIYNTFIGLGAGGGASSTTGDAAPGGNGTHGSGAGGGGAALNGIGNSGAGGNGADGVLIIKWFF